MAWYTGLDIKIKDYCQTVQTIKSQDDLKLSLIIETKKYLLTN